MILQCLKINRIVTDSITDYFFTTSENANKNLLNIGVPEKRIFFVGNTMIDTLAKYRKKLVKPLIWDKFQLKPQNYLVLTLHRPSNVQSVKSLQNYLIEIVENSNNIQLFFQHTKNFKKFTSHKFIFSSLHCIEPLSYLNLIF